MAFDWPGNVRSLKHACERATILAQGDEYQFLDFGLIAAPITLNAAASSTITTQVNESGVPPALTPASTSANAIPSTNNTNHTNSGNTSDQFKLADLEKETIGNAIAEANGNISQAAKLLGLSRAALYRKMEKHGI